MTTIITTPNHTTIYYTSATNGLVEVESNADLKPIKHGRNTYLSKKCDCGICKQANASYMANWRLKRSARREEQLDEAWVRLRPLDRKQCRQCHKFQPKHAFRPSPREDDGRNAKCTTCERVQKGHHRKLEEKIPADDFGRRFCAYGCGREAKTVDHFVPLALGGRDDISNVVLCCKECNESKRAQEPHLWMAMKGLTLDGRYAHALAA